MRAEGGVQVTVRVLETLEGHSLFETMLRGVHTLMREDALEGTCWVQSEDWETLLNTAIIRHRPLIETRAQQGRPERCEVLLGICGRVVTVRADPSQPSSTVVFLVKE